MPFSVSAMTSAAFSFGHEARPGADDLAATGHGLGLQVLGQEDDGQIALEVGLLVDGEEELAVAHGSENVRREVERPDRDPAQPAALAKRREGRSRATRTEHQHAVHRGIAAQRTLDPLGGIFGVGEAHPEDLHRGSPRLKTVAQPAAAGIE